jgi:hypothetical protein
MLGRARAHDHHHALEVVRVAKWVLRLSHGSRKKIVSAASTSGQRRSIRPPSRSGPDLIVGFHSVSVFPEHEVDYVEYDALVVRLRGRRIRTARIFFGATRSMRVFSFLQCRQQYGFQLEEGSMSIGSIVRTMHVATKGRTLRCVRVDGERAAAVPETNEAETLSRRSGASSREELFRAYGICVTCVFRESRNPSAPGVLPVWTFPEISAPAPASPDGSRMTESAAPAMVARGACAPRRSGDGDCHPVRGSPGDDSYRPYENDALRGAVPYDVFSPFKGAT